MYNNVHLKVVLQVEVFDEKGKQKVMKAVSGLEGIALNGFS